MRGFRSGRVFPEVIGMKEKLWQGLVSLWTNERGKFVGTVLGVLFAVCVLVFGFWSTLFVLVCGGVGLFIGHRFDQGTFLEDLRDNLPERFQYWHRF